MFSRYIKSGILTLIAISFVVGCSALVQASDALAGVYVYEKTGFGGEFTITLNSDGTFQYYEGAPGSPEPTASGWRMAAWCFRRKILIILCLSKS